MGTAATVGIAMYLAFYILLSFLFIIWLFAIICRCFQVYSFSDRWLPGMGPIAIMLPTYHELPRGLEASVIESFPKFTYSRSDMDTDMDMKMNMTGECVVCLGVYEENETLRLLPRCGHVFHAECVDTWLRSHATCPFCRANLLPNNDSPAGCGATRRLEVLIR